MEDRVMTRDLTGRMEGRSFTLAQLGRLEEIDGYVFEHPAIPGRHPGKLFLKDQLKLTGMEVSLNKVSPGSGVPFLHKHQRNEELYIFVKGEGLFEIDGQRFDVREGTVIRVAPDGVRSWTNNSSEDLYFFVVQAPAGGLATGSISDGVGVDRSSGETEKPGGDGETDP
jgi:mannose-6-phosphate isomerase-like protein (cupin superfamily)